MTNWRECSFRSLSATLLMIGRKRKLDRLVYSRFVIFEPGLKYSHCSINYQTTQIHLELIKHFVKRLGLGDPLNGINLSVSWWPIPAVVFVALQGSIFQTFAWKTEMEWQIILRLMIVFRSRKTEYKTWAEKIGMKDETLPQIQGVSNSCAKTKDWKLIFAI